MKLLQKTALALIRIKLRLLAIVSPSIAARSAFRLFCTPQQRNLAAPGPVFANAEIIETNFEEYKITGYRWNKGRRPQAMVLHGFESSVVNFDFYIDALVKKGYEVIAFDAPAHGKSSGKRTNALVYRNFIRHIQNEFGPSTRFVAHSFGGLALALAVAELPVNDELRLVLIAPATETRTVVNEFMRIVQLRDPRVIKAFDEIIFNLGGHDLQWFSVTRAMQQIRSKVLWVHDRHDTVTPFRDLAEVRAQNYPNVEFVITEGLGHRRIYKDPEVGRTIVNFL